MFDQDDRHPPFLIDIENEPGDILRLLQIHPSCRFVEQKDLRLHRQSAGHLHPFLETERKRMDDAFSDRLDFEEVDNSLFDLFSQGDLLAAGLAIIDPAGEESRPEMDMMAELDVVDDRHVFEQFHILKGSGNPQGGQLVGLQL
ncbi:MAG: hypothetical protein ACD_87C00221G0001 [uncultured bacterium]|nr:MAG: hypothetical protein ACD_87C00221G0001 [uncultured bacterium]